MTTTLDRAVSLEHRPKDGGAPARSAMVRWAWRMFRREWRQQMLILALIVVAVAATAVGSAVATDTQAPSTLTFGTAQDLASFGGSTPHLASKVAALEHRFGRVQVIESQTLHVPGSVETYALRAQNPNGPFAGPLTSLLSGHYPTDAGQVALTQGLATDFHVSVGGTWHEGGSARQVVGIVQNPDSLLDEFALVLPGQVPHPTQVIVLFDARGVSPQAIGPNVRERGATSTGAFNPTTIVLTIATIGLLLIALVAVGGFTVLAQRRLRAIGMVESLGATDRNIGFAVRANGVVVGVVGAVLGLVLGLVAWLAYRPTAESNSHHVIGVFALPWEVIGPAMALAVLATYVAASRPARSITKVPVVAALSGRPPPPRQVRRSALPGVIFLIGAFFLFGLSGSLGNNGGVAIIIPAFVVLIVGVILVAPFCLSVLGRIGRRAPIAVRLALRDLARYRARSASALSAISLGVLIAIIVVVLAAGRYGNALDYVGPNLASNQLLFYVGSPTGGPAPGTASNATSQPSAATMKAAVDRLAADLGSHDVVQLETTDAGLRHAASGRQFGGQLFVATPKLLRAFGIPESEVNPRADILTMRQGLTTMSKMQLLYTGPTPQKGVVTGTQAQQRGPGGTGPTTFRCPKSACIANPVIQAVSALPSGTSAPNTVITEHAVHTLHLETSTQGWLVQTPSPLSASQINNARLTASAAGMSLETKSSAPSSSEILNWATVFAIALALGILAMSVGLIRSETARDLRTLTAAGASGFARRTITAATAGGLAFSGAVLGAVGGYVACVGWLRTNYTGLQALTHVPVVNLVLVIVGMPVLAALGGWLLAGREPSAIAHQPIE